MAAPVIVFHRHLDVRIEPAANEDATIELTGFAEGTDTATWRARN